MPTLLAAAVKRVWNERPETAEESLRKIMWPALLIVASGALTMLFW